MKNIILIIYFILFSGSAVFKLEASFYRDKIFIGKNKEEYKYFFTATEYTKEADMAEKIDRTVFPLRKKLNLLIVVEIPSSLSISEQELMWNKLEEVNSSLKELNYNSSINFNGSLDKKITTYKIHVYYR